MIGLQMGSTRVHEWSDHRVYGTMLVQEPQRRDTNLRSIAYSIHIVRVHRSKSLAKYDILFSSSSSYENWRGIVHRRDQHFHDIRKSGATIVGRYSGRGQNIRFRSGSELYDYSTYRGRGYLSGSREQDLLDQRNEGIGNIGFEWIKCY